MRKTDQLLYGPLLPLFPILHTPFPAPSVSLILMGFHQTRGVIVGGTSVVKVLAALAALSYLVVQRYCHYSSSHIFDQAPALNNVYEVWYLVFHKHVCR